MQLIERAPFPWAAVVTQKRIGGVLPPRLHASGYDVTTVVGLGYTNTGYISN